MNKIFIVYEHWTLCGRIFYVGKGSGKRAWQSSNRNMHWHRIVKLYGKEVRVVAEYDNETSALEHEAHLINYYRQSGAKLANILDGGTRNSGARHTPESKEKLRIAHTGMKRSREAVEKTIAKLKGVPKSAEHRKKLSLSKLGKQQPLLFKPIICINTGENYKSITLASKFLCVDKSHIVKCCKGKLKHIKGLSFRYVM